MLSIPPSQFWEMTPTEFHHLVEGREELNRAKETVARTGMTENEIEDLQNWVAKMEAKYYGSGT